MHKKILIVSVVILIGIITGTIIHNNLEVDGFSKMSLIKLNIPLEGESEKNVKITNNEEENHFNIYFNKLDNLASTEDKEFSLGKEESKEVKVLFKDNVGEMGAYLGQLIIETPKAMEKIPIILVIEEKNPSFIITQGNIPKYENVYPGGKLGIEIKIFELSGITSQSLEVKYFIKNFDDEIIWSDEENLIAGKSWTKIIPVDSKWAKGEYAFFTLIDYKGIKSIGTHLFTISDKEAEFENVKIFVVAVLVFAIIILVLIFYLIKSKNECWAQLKKQQNQELQKNLDLIKISESRVGRLKDKIKKKKKIKELKKFRKKIIKKIRIKHRLQKREIKILKKQNKTREMNNKLKLWKNQGYKLFEAEKGIKSIVGGDIKNPLKKFEKEGYKTNFLER